MPNDPDSPESRQIADVAINEEETILQRPPSEKDGTDGDMPSGDPQAPDDAS